MLHSPIPQFWERSRCFTVFGKSLESSDSSHPVVLQDTDYCFVFAIEPITFNTLHSNL